MSVEKKALSHFDRLVEGGDLLWKDNAPRISEFQPFNFEFRVAPSLKEKPQNEDESKVSNAFEDPNPDFNLGVFGPGKNHRLVLNKFCVVRPQFVLHTVEYEHQDQGLNDGDLRAGWDALQALGNDYMVIFNGGEDAGASVGHKHLQVIPKAGHIDQITSLLVKEAGSGGIGRAKGLPYQHGVFALPDGMDDEALFGMYMKLLSKFDMRPDEPHNIILTSQWLMVIPRSKAWIGEVSANAASMVGMVWCKTEDQYEGWIQKGIAEVLREMGKPWDK